MTEKKQLCKEERAKNPPERAGLICSYQKHSLAVIAAKGGSTSYSIKGSFFPLEQQMSQ